MKHRILILLLVLVISLLCSCTDPNDETQQHSHSFAADYTSDATHHWLACECGEKGSYAEHNWDEGVITLNPTADSEGTKVFTCTVCQYEKTETLEKLDPDHTHVYDIPYTDEYSHGNKCVCGEIGESTAHTWDEGVVTTPASRIEIGIKTFTCTDCGHKSTQNIPSTTPNGLSFLQSTHYRLSDKLHATPLTLEAEIYVDLSVTGRAGAVFGNYYGIREDWLVEIYENGVPRFYYSDAAGNIKDIRFNNVDVRTGDWAHIALTFDFENKMISFYLNGEVAQVVPCEMDLADDITRYQFVVGGDNRSNNGIYFKGQIRSVSAYADVRTPEEIARSAQFGTNLYADDLIVSYLLNGESSGKDIIDLSGNGYIIQKEWLDSHEPTLDYAYSFAVIGDTQWLSKYKPEKMEGIYDWIISNKDDKKIAHVMGLGDITEDWNTPNKEVEWVRAQEYIFKLNGVIPYSVVRGNHDETKYFNKYFATDEYISQFGGHFMVEGDVRNSYKEIIIGSTKYLLLTLDFGASNEMLAWANEVVLAHPDHRVIVTTHAYHGFDGGHLNYDNVMSSGNITSASDVDADGSRSYNNGQQIWEKFVSLHPNIFLVMSGHTPLEDVFVLQTEGVHGNVVNQMLIDPQWMDPQKDGVGMVCMLYFSEDGTQMGVEWISTDTDKYYKEQNQFVLDLNDSLNAPAHQFSDSYNDTYHYKVCECGYTHNEQPHVYDGGVLNADGFMEYTCACGYKRITSATDDPVALELQGLLEQFYNKGVYYRDTVVGANSTTTYFGGDKFWTTNAEDYQLVSSALTLDDIILGKYGNLRLDLGWNVHEGLYSSVNENTIKGISTFVLGAENSSVTKVTMEQNGALLLIKLWANDNLAGAATIGLYATTTLVNQEGEVLDVIYTKSSADGMCEIVTPKMDGLVAEYDKIILSTKHDELTKTVYYSTIVVWDGVSVSSSLKGSGTEEDPFLIENGADLAYIRDVVNNAPATTPNFSGKYFKLTQSIDLDGYDFYIGDYPGWSTRKGFHGILDGNHCTIRGLDSSKSLFGTIETGSLKNLSVYGQVNGLTTIGGIVGYAAYGATLENLTNYATVNGENTLGGVVGNAENQGSTVINCVNYGNVTGSSWIIGGVAGSGGDTIVNCVNFGNVTSTANDVVGGIAGSTKASGSITNCYNYGTINARGKTGGIVGQSIKPVKDCVNYGDVNGVWALGGIVGYVKEGTVSVINCINNGNVIGSSTGNGGILGLSEAASKVTVENCVNNGSVGATWGAGGIVGDTYGVVTGCVNNGTLNAKGDLGGIVGKSHGNITNCTNNGIVNGVQANIGGILGRLHDSTCLDSINTTNTQNGTVNGPNAQEIIGLVE